MTYWDFFVSSLEYMRDTGQLRICVGFTNGKLGEKELNCVSQLFPHAQEVGVIARNSDELNEGAAAIKDAGCKDARWGIVHMVSDEMSIESNHWHVYTDVWFEGRY